MPLITVDDLKKFQDKTMYAVYKCPGCGADRVVNGDPANGTKYRGGAKCLDCGYHGSALDPKFKRVGTASAAELLAPKNTELSLKSAFARSLMELSREAKVAVCPNCNSDHLRREGGKPGEGPKDRCLTCGYSFPHKPGTITAAQKAASMPDDPMEFEGE